MDEKPAETEHVEQKALTIYDEVYNARRIVQHVEFLHGLPGEVTFDEQARHALEARLREAHESLNTALKEADDLRNYGDALRAVEASEDEPAPGAPGSAAHERTRVLEWVDRFLENSRNSGGKPHERSLLEAVRAKILSDEYAE